MKFTVGCNWDEQLIKEFSKTDVLSLFGKLDKDIIGGGRPTYLSRQITREYAENYIKKCHDADIEFNYLLNAACLGNMEFNKEWHCKMLDFLNWLNLAGVRRVTVAVPYLIEIIKKRYPHMHISASTFARVNTVQRARYFEDLGVDEIPLDFMINRDFKTLSAISKSVDCTLTLLVNNSCLYNCPYSFYHAEMLAHSSQESHLSGGYCQEYCLYSCTKRKYVEPVELIRSRWIRPEDLVDYEELGINHFKIADRLKETSWIVNTVKAYLNRSYSGNLAEILNLPMGAIRAINKKFSVMLEKEKELGVGEFANMKPVIDNKKLVGFLSRFKKIDCSRMNCNICGYCSEVALEVIKMPDEHMRATTIASFDNALKMLISSESVVG